MEPAGDLVGVLVELAARVEYGHHHLDGRLPFGRVHLDRDAPAVVGDGDRVVFVDRDLDVVAVAGERLVDRVVDDLVDEVVEPAHAHVADVHRGALADRFKPFEDLDVRGPVVSTPRDAVAGRRERVGRRGRRAASGRGLVLVRGVLRSRIGHQSGGVNGR